MKPLYKKTRSAGPILLALLFIAMMISSCERENYDDIIITDPVYVPTTDTINDLIKLLKPESNNFIRLGCLKVDLPMKFVSMTGDTIGVKNLAEVEVALAFSGEQAIKDFAFPVLVDDQFSRFNVIYDNRTLATFYSKCVPTSGWSKAVSKGGVTIPAFLPTKIDLDLSYPVQLVADNDIVVANDELEFILAKVAHPELEFDTPFNIVSEDGQDIMIDDLESFFNSVYEYTDVVPPYVEGNIMINGFGCNEMQFPITVKIEDDEDYLVNNIDDYAVLILTGDWMELQYPFELLNESTGLTEVNDLDDLEGIQALCDYNNEPIYACNLPPHILFFFNVAPNLCYYIISFPLQLQVEGMIIEITDFNQYLNIQNTVNEDEIELIYPITVDVNGMNRTYYSDADICMYSKECE